MIGYTSITGSLGIPLWLIFITLIWTMVWKFSAMWKSARRGSVVWFIILGVVNTMGILPILYIYVFSNIGKSKPVKKVRKRKRR